MTAPTTNKPAIVGTQLAIAACCMVLTGCGSEIQLLPVGEFKAIDGRPAVVDGKPTGIACWRLDDIQGAALAVSLNRRVTPYVLDYEHQTLLARENGKPAPAAGWFTKVEWRNGVGLFAVDTEWTEPAAAMIEKKEYRFISPVLAYDKSGVVVGILMAAITNYPAITGMSEIMLAAATVQYAALTSIETPLQEPLMEPLLEQLRWMLNLPVASTAEDILAQLTKLADAIKQGQGEAGTAAASCDLVALFTTMQANIAALSAAKPDPAKYAPVETVIALQTKIAALSAQANNSGLDETIRAAMACGKLLPETEAWARNLGATNIAALTAMLDGMPAVAALSSMQTKGIPPAITGAGVTALTADQKALCAAFGVSHEDFQKTLKAEQKA